MICGIQQKRIANEQQAGGDADGDVAGGITLIAKPGWARAEHDQQAWRNRNIGALRNVTAYSLAQPTDKATNRRRDSAGGNLWKP